MQFGTVQVRPERCMSCKRCVLACAVAHSQSKDLLGAMKEFPKPKGRVTLHRMGGLTVPTECRHCDAAACVMVCPSGAMHKPTAYGPVILDQEKCVGCGHCVLACPYGVPRYAEKGLKVIKCDQCMDRLEQGLVPACVEACPTGTLLFDQRSEVSDGETVNTAQVLWERIQALRSAGPSPGDEPPKPALREV